MPTISAYPHAHANSETSEAASCPPARTHCFPFSEWERTRSSERSERCREAIYPLSELASHTTHPDDQTPPPGTKEPTEENPARPQIETTSPVHPTFWPDWRVPRLMLLMGGVRARACPERSRRISPGFMGWGFLVRRERLGLISLKTGVHGAPCFGEGWVVGCSVLVHEGCCDRHLTVVRMATGTE